MIDSLTLTYINYLLHDRYQILCNLYLYNNFDNQELLYTAINSKHRDITIVVRLVTTFFVYT